MRAVAPGELKAVVGADQVGPDQIVRTAVVSGEHGRLGGTLDERVDFLDREQVVEHANVAVHESYVSLAQAGQVELAAPSPQVVQRSHVPVRVAGAQADREVGADEAGTAGDEDTHSRVVWPKPSRKAVLARHAPVRCRADAEAADDAGRSDSY